MLVLNMVFWIFVTSGFYILRSDLNPAKNDLIPNGFIPSHYDQALGLLLGGLIIIWLWHKLSLLFLNTWDVLSRCPIQLWALRNLGIWGYGLIGMFVFPQIILLISFPGLFIIEKIGFHVGDFVMPPILTITGAMYRFIF